MPRTAKKQPETLMEVFSTCRDVLSAASAGVQNGILASTAALNGASLAAADILLSKHVRMKEASIACILEDAAMEQGWERCAKGRFSPTGHIAGADICRQLQTLLRLRLSARKGL